MILSHKYKFIFLKTKKTAGTSIEIALSKFCGPDDIITPISEKDEQTRRQLGYRGPQNYLPATNGSAWNDKLVALGLMKPKRFYNHMSAAEVKALVDDKVWNEYYKFCVERNPWDRMTSLYYWIFREKPAPPFSQFVRSRKYRMLKNGGRNVYTLSGRFAVNHVCRFEDLANELEAVRQQIGLPEELELPRAKTIQRIDRRNYRELFSPADQARVGRLFRDEIQMFNYQF
jgi:hypothetical protein